MVAESITKQRGGKGFSKVKYWFLKVSEKKAHSSPRRAEKENVSISIILKERSPILQYVAQLLWNLADISMLKRLIRARLSQTQQKTEITRSAVNCYSTEIFRFHSMFVFNTLIIQVIISYLYTKSSSLDKIRQPVLVVQDEGEPEQQLGHRTVNLQNFRSKELQI